MLDVSSWTFVGTSVQSWDVGFCADIMFCINFHQAMLFAWDLYY